MNTQSSPRAIHDLGGGQNPPCTGLTTDVLPEANTPELGGSSDTGVSTRNVLSRKSIKSEPNKNEIPHWYVIRCAYGREKIAYELFLNNDIEAFYPTIVSSKITSGKKNAIEESRIPNILFAYGSFEQLKRFVYDNYHDSTKHLRFYYNHHHDGTKEPLVVPMWQMKSLKKICDAETEDKHLDLFIVEKFRNGQLVRVIDGPFAGVVGTVHRYKGQQRVGIIVEGLFTITTAYISKEKLELAETCYAKSK